MTALWACDFREAGSAAGALTGLGGGNGGLPETHLALQQGEGNVPLRQRMFYIGPLGFRVRIDRAVTGNGRLQSWVQLHRLRDGLRRVLGRRILPHLQILAKISSREKLLS